MFIASIVEKGFLLVYLQSCFSLKKTKKFGHANYKEHPSSDKYE